MKKRISNEDLQHIASSLDDVIPHISNSRIFITGGTGFFGKWLLETLIFFNDEHKANCSAVVLSRNPDKFINDYPHFRHKCIEYFKGDIKDFTYPEGEFQYCIHAALEGENLDKTDELEIVNAAYQGTQRVLEFAKQKNVRSVLYTSSGGLYGRQPPELRFMPEHYPGAPDTMQMRSCYGEGKRLGEYLCAYYGNKYGMQIKIARCYAFVGPYLALNAHFVIGNFISNCLKKESMLIKGDGTPVRSYMYAADLVIYLFKTLIHGDSLVPYNVGSMDEISVVELAEKMASFFSPRPEIIIKQKKADNVLPERYVPDNTRLMTKFPSVKNIGVDEAIKRTVAFYEE